MKKHTVALGASRSSTTTPSKAFWRRGSKGPRTPTSAGTGLPNRSMSFSGTMGTNTPSHWKRKTRNCGAAWGGLSRVTALSAVLFRVKRYSVILAQICVCTRIVIIQGLSWWMLAFATETTSRQARGILSCMRVRLLWQVEGRGGLTSTAPLSGSKHNSNQHIFNGMHWRLPIGAQWNARFGMAAFTVQWGYIYRER